MNKPYKHKYSYRHPVIFDMLGALLVVLFFSAITWAAISMTTHQLTVHVTGRSNYTATHTVHWRCREYAGGQVCITHGVHWY